MSEREADRMVRQFVWRRCLTTGLVVGAVVVGAALGAVALAESGPATWSGVKDAFDVGDPFIDPPMVVPIGDHPDEGMDEAPVAPARLPTDERPPEEPEPRAAVDAPALNDATVQSEAARAHLDALPSEHEVASDRDASTALDAAAIDAGRGPQPIAADTGAIGRAATGAEERLEPSEASVRDDARLPPSNDTMTPAPIPLARADDEAAPNHDVVGAFRRAETLMEQDRPYEALLQYEDAAESGPDPAPAFVGMGRAYLSIGKPEAAETQFRRALNADPDYAPAMFELGAVLQHLKRPVEAADEYRRYLAVAPDAPEAEAALEALQMLEARPL